MLEAAVTWLVITIGKLGYLGIVCLMFLESSFFPFPSEVVIPPAGYLAFLGEMNLFLVIFMGILGSILGALFNYWISLRFGRPFFQKYGRYFFISESTLDKADGFFAQHGHISTLIGRLLPGIRQYISLPAGLSRMPLFPFCLFTAIGSGLWVAVLAFVGYWVWNNKELVSQYLHNVTILAIILCLLLGGLYVFRVKQKKSR